MTAICPAGPPNVCSEIRNHAFTAVRNGTVRAGGASLVTASSSGRWSRGLAAEQQSAAVVLVEAVEDGAGDGVGAPVLAGNGQAPQDDLRAGRLGGVRGPPVQDGLA